MERERREKEIEEWKRKIRDKAEKRRERKIRERELEEGDEQKRR